jgi:hypothetical protein
VIASALLPLCTTFVFAHIAEPAKVTDASKGRIPVTARQIELQQPMRRQLATIAAVRQRQGFWQLALWSRSMMSPSSGPTGASRWKDDKNPGDALGDNRGNVRHIVAP